jgi:hypothetical protein
LASGITRLLPKEIIVMKNLSILAAGLIGLAVASSPALAVGTSARTFVSGSPPGSDMGTCSIAAPCRTFAYALTQTAPSGEIIVLTSGGYGAVTIGQAVSIINVGNFAGVTVASGNGITINAQPMDSVTLRGLTVDGGGTGSNGIVFNSGAKLTIDQCDAQNFVGGSSSVGNGILIQPASGSHNIIVTNTTLSNNGGAGMTLVSPSGGTATTGLSIDHVNASNNTSGFALSPALSSGPATVSISNSIASGNSNNGYFFGFLTASLDASYASNNGTGVEAIGTGATVRLAHSAVTGNTSGWIVNSGGVLLSDGDNTIEGNAGSETGPPTYSRK